MSLHTKLPIYKKGCELVQLAFSIQQQMPRGYKRTLGEKITGHCTDMLNLMAMANASRGAIRAAHIRELLKLHHATTVLLRVCHNMRLISHQVWADSVQMLDSIGKQGGGWLNSATSPAA